LGNGEMHDGWGRRVARLVDSQLRSQDYALGLQRVNILAASENPVTEEQGRPGKNSALSFLVSSN
jgi:hypothetical protein